MPNIELAVTIDSYDYKYRLNEGQLEQLSTTGYGWFPLHITRSNRPFCTRVIELLRAVERGYK